MVQVAEVALLKRRLEEQAIKYVSGETVFLTKQTSADEPIEIEEVAKPVLRRAAPRVQRAAPPVRMPEVRGGSGDYSEGGGNERLVLPSFPCSKELELDYGTSTPAVWGLDATRAPPGHRKPLVPRGIPRSPLRTHKLHKSGWHLHMLTCI